MEYTYNIPASLKAITDKDNRMIEAINMVLKELPLQPSIPILIRIKAILEWGLEGGETNKG